MKSTDIEQYVARLNAPEEIKDKFRQHGIGYRWLALWVISIANVTVVLSSTIINIAMPDIMGAFGVGQDRAQWLVTIGIAIGTVTMLCSDWMVRAVGLRSTVILSLILFTLGSLLGGEAPSFDILILSRILQGIPYGLMLPLSITVIFQLFPPGKLGLPMGIGTAALMLAPSFGPSVGGIVIDSLSWHYVFFIGIPLAVPSLLMAIAVLPEHRGIERPPFDWTGLILLSGAIISLLVMLSNGERDGWQSDATLLRFALFSVFAIAFFLWERRVDEPIVEFRFFREPNFVVLSTVGFLFGGTLFGSIYLVPLFLRLIQHVTPTNTGLIMIPTGLVMALGFGIGGRLADKVDLRLIITIGSLVSVLSFWLMAFADANTALVDITVWVSLARVGAGLVMPVMQLGAVSQLESSQISKASGTFTFLRQLGGAFGTNLTSIALERRTSVHRDALLDTQTFDNSDSMTMLDNLQQIAGAIGYVGTESWRTALAFLHRIIDTQALIIGFQDCYLILALLFLAILPPVWLLKRTA